MAETAEQKSESTLRREADYVATQTLKESHLAEFNALKQKEMAARGIKWQPKPTEEEKAMQQVQDLLAKFPRARTLLNGGDSAPPE